MRRTDLDVGSEPPGEALSPKHEAFVQAYQMLAFALASKKSSLPAPSGPKSRSRRFCANWRCSTIGIAYQQSSPMLSFALSHDPIPLPQRLHLLCAAKHVERIGSDAGAVLGQIVVSSECDVVCAESGFPQGERFTPQRLADVSPILPAFAPCRRRPSQQ
jgi:hypothetical protein